MVGIDDPSDSHSFRVSLEPLGRWVLSLQEHEAAVQAALRPLIESGERMHRLIEAALRPTQEFHQLIAQASAGITVALERFQSYAVEVAPLLLEFKEQFSSLPGRMRAALLAIARSGWYLDPEMSLPDVWELEKKLGDSPAAYEQWLIEHFTERLSSIQADLARRHPRRAGVLASAFRAHLRGEFDLSVPVFLAQAEGICQERVSVSPYAKRGNVPVLAAYVRSLSEDSLQAAALHPLTESLPLTASAHERDDAFSELNRHQVLHGESVDYGTRVNSLKAISFINYVSYALTEESPPSS